ncbi:hypothetical protein PN499_08525 [Kamptonema animale CS-326]|uniref:hypothetical protein n=1 Tax=Kamptonema animale TaxID=92934 RepID=UPI002330B0B7|nr:hypothetical protein [Kamptonema animale]MDB9511223.1 hypothetical protein [Kamptonema animale CS-326]
MSIPSNAVRSQPASQSTTATTHSLGGKSLPTQGFSYPRYKFYLLTYQLGK